jgi:2-keto-3-deoxy-L-fuconate dehydrogenase
MSNRLAGKTAFVTAAGQGIGRATALAFAQQGARVIATDVNAAALESLHKECGCTIDVLDVTKADAVLAAAAKHGPVDVLFNGAGFVHAGSVLDCTEDEWEFAFSLNVRSQFRMIKAFLPGMLKKGNGSIINVASVAGSIKGAPNRFVYGATKAAVIHHPRRALQCDLSRHGGVAFFARPHRSPSQSQWTNPGAGRSSLRGASTYGACGSRRRNCGARGVLG